MKNAGAVDTTSTSQAQTEATTKAEEKTGGNFSDEMKIPHSYDLDEYGADSVERDGDHKNSPYFSNLDFYNMTSSDTLTILPKFKTMQQTSEWSCGVTSALMVLEYFDSLGDHNEYTLAEMRTNSTTQGAPYSESIVNLIHTLGGVYVFFTYYFDDESAAREYMTHVKIQAMLSELLPLTGVLNALG